MDNRPCSGNFWCWWNLWHIVFINTNGEHVTHDQYITAQMNIINNGEGMLNYGDTITHPNQTKDFDGLIAVKYRGNSSYECSPKKPYAIRVIDKPLSEGGKKKKAKLLGMRKGKKWALKAVRIDKSMIRDALSFELARPYMEFVPQTRFCEVVVDGVYRGIYSLSEQITADRLKIGKPGDSDEALTGGYLLEMDFRAIKGFHESKYWNVKYVYEYPDSNKLTHNQRIYINNFINEVEDFFYSEKEFDATDKIDEQSMIDYQLITEFSHNGDNYTLSTFIYKYPDNIDSGLKFSLWDFDLGYGNYATSKNSRIDTWIYADKECWWTKAMEREEYVEKVKQRWSQYRKSNFTNEQVEQVVDSLTTLLTICNAEKRNSDAWRIWNKDSWLGPKRIFVEKYISSSYEEEIEYLKEWIHKRLAWMDRELLEKKDEMNL